MPMRRIKQVPFDWLSLAVLFGTLLAILFSFADYGMSWDEPYSVIYGRNVLRYLSTFGADRLATEGAVSLRGGAFHALVEVLCMVAPSSGLLVRRLVTPLVGFLGLCGCWRLARMLGGPACGFWAVLLLALTPLYYGNMFINPTDTPFATGYVWGLLFVVHFVQGLPRPRTRSIIAAGFVIGIAISTRIGGALLLVYCGALCALYIAQAGGSVAERWASVRSLLPAASLLAFVCFLFTLALWPAALQHPIAVLFKASAQAAAFPKHERVLLAGRALWSDALPWFYQLAYLTVQLPEVVLLFLGVGVPVALQDAWRAWRARDRSAWAAGGALLFGALVPLLAASTLHPVDYDGARHWLFVVPPLICLAARGVTWTLEHCARRQLAQALVIAAVGLGCARSVLAMSELHPYEYTFYNALVGGTRGASGRYELDYWVTSFREAIGALTQHIEQSPPNRRAGEPFKLLVCGSSSVAAVYLPRSLVLTQVYDEADFVLATTKWSCHERYPGAIVAEVKRMGVPFAVVKRLPGH